MGDDNHWVSIEAAAIALGVKRRRALEIARLERWRTATGQKPKQYLFADIQRTYEHRKDTRP